MLLNSSSFSNDSTHQPNSLLSSSSANVNCFLHESSSKYFGGFYNTFILIVLPLCVLVLHHGLQQWRRNGLKASTAWMSHNDCFTYHLVVVELFGVVGCFTCSCGIYRDDGNLINVGGFLWSFSWYGETFFHILTCVERFLAVVHPITYQALRKERGIQIRNKVIPIVWLISILWTCTMIKTTPIPNFLVMMFGLIVVVLCSISALFVLIRPSPGVRRGFRRSPDKKKQKAFFTIMAILGALLLRFGASLVWFVVIVLELSNPCVFFMSVVWLTLPSSSVLPLLFLHRAGKKLCLSNICRLAFLS